MENPNLNTSVAPLETLNLTQDGASGGSNFGNTENDLKISAPDAVFKPGKVLFKVEGALNDVDRNTVEQWLKSIN